MASRVIKASSGTAHATRRETLKAPKITPRGRFGKCAATHIASRTLTWIAAKTRAFVAHVDPKKRPNVATLRVSSSRNAAPMKKNAASRPPGSRSAGVGALSGEAECQRRPHARDTSPAIPSETR